MTKELWINLPVKDLKKSKQFFSDIGFTLHERHLDSEEMAGLVIGDHELMVMLFPVKTFEGYTKHEITDSDRSTEVLLSVSTHSRAEVDEMIEKVKNAGGAIFEAPGEQNGLYGAGFCDLDGHRWNLLYMGA